MTNTETTQFRLNSVELQVFRNLQNLALKENISRLGLLLCVSGGRDSVAMLSIIKNITMSPLYKKLPNLIIEVAHFNHCKRGLDSDGDSNFVTDLCNSFNIKCHTFVMSQKIKAGSNFQKEARNWRYSESQALRQNLHICSECSHSFVATAHHAQDNLETILLHLIRGSGIMGLSGMQLVDLDNHLLRPLIFLEPQELDSYIAEKNLKFRSDASNFNLDYTRNFIRHKIYPLMLELNPSVNQAFSRLSTNINQSIKLLNSLVGDYKLELSDFTTSMEILLYARKVSPEVYEQMSEKSLNNLLTHIEICRAKKGSYEIAIGNNWQAQITESFLLFQKTAE